MMIYNHIHTSDLKKKSNMLYIDNESISLDIRPQINYAVD